jgi:tetratricopeptide (TPR) repeat protein
VPASAPARLRATLAMVHGSRALEQHRFAEAADAYRRQAACYREEGSEFGECLALNNLAMVSLDLGEVDSAIELLERAIAGLQRMRAPYGLGGARSLLVLARALRGDDDDALISAREAYQGQVNNGAASCDKALMAAAMFHARRGDLPRAALIAACVTGPNVRGTKKTCPMDDRLDVDLQTLLTAGMSETERCRCRDAGTSLTLAHVASISFDGVPIDNVSAQGAPAAN